MEFSAIAWGWWVYDVNHFVCWQWLQWSASRHCSDWQGMMLFDTACQPTVPMQNGSLDETNPPKIKTDNPVWKSISMFRIKYLEHLVSLRILAMLDAQKWPLFYISFNISTNIRWWHVTISATPVIRNRREDLLYKDDDPLVWSTCITEAWRWLILNNHERVHPNLMAIHSTGHRGAIGILLQYSHKCPRSFKLWAPYQLKQSHILHWVIILIQ